MIDRRLALMRRAATQATTKYGIGGRPKAQGYAPKPVTLAHSPPRQELETSAVAGTLTQRMDGPRWPRRSR